MPISPMPKGICYGNDVFPAPYDPSTANTTRVFFGSDNAAAHMAPLWGGQYTSSTGAKCLINAGGLDPCRDDLARIAGMGVQVIRLYDWEPRNDHSGFLDKCLEHGLKVLVSVSNYFLQGGGLGQMETLIPKLITSYSNGNDYHAAIAGVVIGNEFEGYGVAECVKFTRRFVEIERSSFASHRQLPIGHPLSFNAENGKNPCWEKWDSLVPALKPIMGSRLFLAPQTYNPASDLFVRFNGKAGWVDQTYNEYNLPIWFTEIGQDRTKQNYAEIVKDQLEACLKFSQANPNKLLGACFFSYADKVWLPVGHSEASYGAHSHGPKGCTITYTDKDFKIWDTAADGTLNIDSLRQTELYKAVYSAYQAK